MFAAPAAAHTAAGIPAAGLLTVEWLVPLDRPQWDADWQLALASCPTSLLAAHPPPGGTVEQLLQRRGSAAGPNCHHPAAVARPLVCCACHSGVQHHLLSACCRHLLQHPAV